MRTNPSAHRGFAGETDIMNRNKKFIATTIAALAGTGIALMTAPAHASRLGGNTNQAPVTGGDLEATPLVLDTEKGANSNDTFETATVAVAPLDDRLDIAGVLSKSDSDGVCRDVDFYQISDLIPLADYCISMTIVTAQDATMGWFNKNGELLQVDRGLLCVVADTNGDILFAVSGHTDEDFDGNDDKSGQSHGVCVEYRLSVDIQLPADVNGDALIDIDDVRAMLGLIGSTDAPEADLNRDGIVDAADLRVLADEVSDKRARGLAEKKAKAQ